MDRAQPHVIRGLDRRFRRLPIQLPDQKLEGKPRAEIIVPISPSGMLSDSVVYKSAADPDVRFYLPRLRLRADGTSYDLRITNEAGRWSIRFGIEPYPAPELGDDVRTTALPFDLVDNVHLAYEAPPMARTLSASEIIPDAGGWTIGFDTDLPGKDEVLWALASERGIKLVVPRGFTAAVPVVSAPAEPVGQFRWIGQELQLSHLIAKPIRDVTPEPVVAEPPPVVIEPETEPPPMRVRDHRHRAGANGVPMQRMVAPSRVVNQAFRRRTVPDISIANPTIAVPIVRRIPIVDSELVSLNPSITKPVVATQRLAMIERFRDIAFDVEQVVVAAPDAPQTEVRYREAHTVIASEMPLRLEPAAHPAIFAGATATAPRFKAVRVLHPPGPEGRSHVYFQDQNRPSTFHHLADAYVLDRTETPPQRPAVVFRVEHGDDEASTIAALTFRLVPRVDHDRLEAAAVELARQVPPPQAGERTPDVTLVPAQAEAELNLGLPVGGELEAPPLDLVNGFVAQVFCPFENFQDVFAALATGQELGTLLRGNIEVKVDTGDSPASPSALIPVDLRFGSANSEVLTAVDSESAGGPLILTLLNSSESPVRIDDLPLRVTRGATEVPATSAGLALPLVLAAGDVTSLEVTPDGPLEGEGELDVLVDFSGVVPLPDPEAILALTLDQQIAQQSSREVSVVIPRTRLTGDDPPRAVFIEFAGSSEVVQLDAENPQVKAGVPVPLVDVLLRRDSATYRFRQTVLRDSGEQRDTEWRTSDAGILVVPVA